MIDLVSFLWKLAHFVAMATVCVDFNKGPKQQERANEIEEVGVTDLGY